MYLDLVLLELLVSPEQREPQVLLASRVLLDHLELLDRLVHMDLLVGFTLVFVIYVLHF